MPEENVELRGNCPRSIVDVIDGWRRSQRMNRAEAVNYILRAWAVNKLHEMNLVGRLARGNPLLAEAERTGAETERGSSPDSEFGGLTP